MATERDELVAVVVKAIDVHAPSDWYTDDDHSTEHDIADAILAAGFRRVGEDEVIVDRETVKLAVRWGEFVEDYGSDTAWTMTYDAPALKQMQDALGGDE